jgi:hypothetical protein
MAAFENAFQARGRFDFIDCYQCLKPFFEKLGCRQIDKNHTHPDFGEAVPMLLGNADRRHLASVKSPFLKVIHRYPEDKGTTILSQSSPSRLASSRFLPKAQGKQPPPCQDVPTSKLRCGCQLPVGTENFAVTATAFWEAGRRKSYPICERRILPLTTAGTREIERSSKRAISWEKI